MRIWIKKMILVSKNLCQKMKWLKQICLKLHVDPQEEEEEETIDEDLTTEIREDIIIGVEITIVEVIIVVDIIEVDIIEVDIIEVDIIEVVIIVAMVNNEDIKVVIKEDREDEAIQEDKDKEDANFLLLSLALPLKDKIEEEIKGKEEESKVHPSQDLPQIKETTDANVSKNPDKDKEETLVMIVEENIIKDSHREGDSLLIVLTVLPKENNQRRIKEREGLQVHPRSEKKYDFKFLKLLKFKFCLIIN